MRRILRFAQKDIERRSRNEAPPCHCEHLKGAWQSLSSLSLRALKSAWQSLSPLSLRALKSAWQSHRPSSKYGCSATFWGRAILPWNEANPPACSPYPPARACRAGDFSRRAEPWPACAEASAKASGQEPRTTFCVLTCHFVPDLIRDLF